MNSIFKKTVLALVLGVIGGAAFILPFSTAKSGATCEKCAREADGKVHCRPAPCK